MRTLVTGAGGMLGSALVPALAEAGHHVFPTDLRAPRGSLPESTTPILRIRSAGFSYPLGRLDVRLPHHINDWIDRVQPDLVVHLAAETDVDRCELDPKHAHATNAEGALHVASACRAAGLPLAYISTAGVFDGEKDEPYTEVDPAHPINVYGRSKLDGEQHVLSLVERSYVVRAGWMVGGGDRDHKFVAKILSQLRAGATTLYAVGDRWGTPTYAPDFARCFGHMVAGKHYGLYHMACLGKGTRYHVAREILRILGRDGDVQLVEVQSEFFRDRFPAPRPRSEMMRNDGLTRLGLNRMRPWEESLREYLITSFPELCTARAESGAS